MANYLKVLFIFSLTFALIHAEVDDLPQPQEACEPCKDPPLLPLMSLLGAGIQFLTGEPFPSHFQVCCNEKLTTPDYKYSMPDGTNYIYDDWCEATIETYYAQTYKEIIDARGKDFGFGITFKMFSFSHSRSSFKSKQMIDQKQCMWQQSRGECHLYRAKLYGMKKPQLQPYLLKKMNQLPYDYNYGAYQKFLMDFGTHSSYYMTAGGSLEQDSHTEAIYHRTKTIQEMKKQSAISFIVSLNKGSSKRSELDKAYVTLTSFEQIRNRGGNPGQIGNTTVTQWQGTVRDIPAIIQQQFNFIGDYFTPEWAPSIPDIQRKQPHVERALQQYIQGFRGCTNPKAKNWDKYALVDDGSCRFSNFRGIYSHNSCHNLKISNYFTSDLKCPDNSVSLPHSQTISMMRNQICRGSQVACLDKNGEQSYGGSYTICKINQKGSSVNPISGNYACSAGFDEVLIGLSNNNQKDQCEHYMCINKKDDYLGGGYQTVDETCKADAGVRNQLTGDYSCPEGQQGIHFATVLTSNLNCLAKQHYCIKIEKF